MAMARTGKRRRLAYVVGESGAFSDEEGDEDSGGDRSSDNEYAEGLGCAHVKRFGDDQRSAFEFDNHDREEYFQQPVSHECTRIIERHGPPLSGEHAASGHAMSTALRELESVESDGSADERAERAVQNRDRQLAIIARRAERRALATQGADAAVDPSRSERSSLGGLSIVCCRRNRGAGRSAVLSSVFSRGSPNVHGNGRGASAAEPQRREETPSAEWTRLWDNVSTLAALRCRADENRVAHVDPELALEALEVLKTVQVNAKLLRTTGAGLELNQSFWRKHSRAEISAASQAVLDRWRAEIEAERRVKA